MTGMTGMDVFINKLHDKDSNDFSVNYLKIFGLKINFNLKKNPQRVSF